MKLFLGVDPGRSGAMALVREDGMLVSQQRLDATDADVAEWLRFWTIRIPYAVLEQVNAMPKQGVTSSFKFGQSFGFLTGLLVAFQIPFETIRPAKWQQAMSCRTGGDKNITKQMAQRLFPAANAEQPITHRTADAILLAEFARRLKAEREV